MKKLLIILFGLTEIFFAQEKINPQILSKAVHIYYKMHTKSVKSISPQLWENKIFICSNSGKVACIDSAGREFWKRDLSADIVTSPLPTDGYVTVGTSSGDIISLIAHTGEQLQSIGVDDSVTTDLLLLKYEGDQELFLPKQSNSKSSLVFGTAKGSLICLDLETLQEYWHNNDSKGRISGDPIFVQNKILFSSADGFLYSIDSRSGLMNWRWKESENINFSNAKIISDGKKIYAVSNDLRLYCLDLLLGKLIWKTDKPDLLNSKAVTGDKKNIIAKSDDGRILFFSADKGNLIRQIKFDTLFDSAATNIIEQNGKIIYSNDNAVYMINNKFKIEKIMEFGGEKVNFLLSAGDKKLIAASSAGTIVLFGIEE